MSRRTGKVTYFEHISLKNDQTCLDYLYLLLLLLLPCYVFDLDIDTVIDLVLVVVCVAVLDFVQVGVGDTLGSDLVGV